MGKRHLKETDYADTGNLGGEGRRRKNSQTVLYAKENYIYMCVYIIYYSSIRYLLDSWGGMKEGRQVQGIVQERKSNHVLQEY